MFSLFSSPARRSRLLLMASFPFFSLSVLAQTAAPHTRVRAYPNPSTGVFTVESDIPLSELNAILITDMRGKVIHGYSIENDMHSLTIHMEEQPVGNYQVFMLFREWDEEFQISKY